jgi:hypothetical protein
VSVRRRPFGPVPMPFEERYWSKVDLSAGPDECWPWTGYRNPAGYGDFWSIKNGKDVSLRAHRVSYELLVGPIPEGLVIDHLCRVRHCVNPSHLEPVTVRENTLRGDTPAKRTHCIHGHEFTPENIIRRPSRPNARDCRTCAIARMRRARAAARDRLSVGAS